MNVQQLEDIALRSHGDKLRETAEDSTELESYEEYLGISFPDRIAQLRRTCPSDQILVADLGGHTGKAASGMNQVEGIVAFMIDKSPAYNSAHGLPKSRVVCADLNSMPEIPDNTFHYAISFNCLSYTNLRQSLPEILRVLRPGGVADLDIEFWLEHRLQDLRALQMNGSLSLGGVYSGFRGNLSEYLQHLKDLQEKGKTDRLAKIECQRDAHLTRFEIAKA